MCGITGVIDSTAARELDSEIAAMTEALRHRGPNDSGLWSDPGVGIALGHRRLSILDLSPAGRQPMHSRQQRFVITFNGEIYNYRALTGELCSKGHIFNGSSDTEVMLAAFEQWGIQGAIERFNGMFAFAVWDRKERLLHLARDRMGEKPLYYGWNSGLFLFASELKAFLAHPRFRPTIDTQTAALGLRYSYIPAPWSIYRDVFKLPAASILRLSVDDLRIRPSSFSPQGQSRRIGIHPEFYWKPAGLIASDPPQRFAGSAAEAVSHLDSLLRDAVKIRMISDVPIGAFLSGGIDSSTIVALMQQESARRIKTFSIGFHSKGFNEADFAKKVARHLGTEHTELYVSSQDLVDVIPLLPRVYDEPFCDSSQIPTYLVSKLTSGNVSVALSGDGGDELFCGYERYLWADSFWARVAPIPPQIRRKLSIAIGSSLAASIATRVASLAAGVPSSVKVIQKVETLSRVLRATNRRELYHGLVSHWIKDTAAERDVDALSTIFATYHANPRQEFLDEMMSLDLRSYLPDDILVKVDRASMAVSLEARTPFLDHRVIEFSLGLPTSFKVSNGRGKVILRKLLNRYVPSNLTDRPKMGFGVPISHWLRAELRPWAEELLSEQKLYRSGFLDPVPIRKRWQQHLAGTHNWEHHIWDILMLQSWLESHSSLSL